MNKRVSQRLCCVIALLFWGAYAIALMTGHHILANTFSPISAFLVGCSMIIFSRSLKKYGLTVVLGSLSVFFWVLGDIFFFINNDSPFGTPFTGYIAELLYKGTTIVMVVGLIAYVWTTFRNKAVIRLFSDAFLFSVSTILIATSVFTYFTKVSLKYTNFKLEHFVFTMFSMVIIILTMMIFVERGLNSLSWAGVIMIISLIMYGFLDIRYSLLDAEGISAISPELDIFFLLSLNLLGVAFACTTEEKLEAKDTSHQSGKIGVIIDLCIMAVGFVMHLYGIVNEGRFFTLLITTVAYLLLIRIIDANELSQQYLAEKEAEKELLESKMISQKEELQEVTEKLANISNLDLLTGLRNRRGWDLYCEELRRGGISGRIMMYSVDINYFKIINDTYGHAAGDAVLIEVGKRLASIEEDFIHSFRIAGDQFLVVVIDPNEEIRPDRFADFLIDLFDRSFDIESEYIKVTFSIGGAIYPKDTNNLEKLLSYAESARYTIKHTGSASSCTFFDNSIMPKIQRKKVLEQKLQVVNYDEQFELYYQPQVKAKSGELIGMEALLRWKEPEFGFVSPMEFIPIAEEMGIMLDMGNWITKQATRQIVQWNTTYHKNLVVGINVSPAQLRDIKFVDKFLDIMRASKVDTNWVDVEITESMALNGIMNNAEIISRIQNAGLTMSVDDFGTGYASFANMISFHFDRIKIAKELVDEIVENRNARVVVKAITGMAKDMGLHTIAEGVEDKEQLDVLVELGCEQIQGYYFDKPLPADTFEKRWL
ncbi:MAG: bifunctional diguanylate cyclase/phosphodiesterase [Lachnospiraceae bacterium]|nr:bifunctional diguanylate cyclase/phosphodiesterase [Lachnospiraceae bacterium]